MKVHITYILDTIDILEMRGYLEVIGYDQF